MVFNNHPPSIIFITTIYITTVCTKIYTVGPRSVMKLNPLWITSTIGCEHQFTDDKRSISNIRCLTFYDIVIIARSASVLGFRRHITVITNTREINLVESMSLPTMFFGISCPDIRTQVTIMSEDFVNIFTTTIHREECRLPNISTNSPIIFLFFTR